MGLQSELIDFITTNTTIDQVYYMEAPTGTNTPYHVFQDVSDVISREHLSSNENLATFQLRSNYKSDTVAQDIDIHEQFKGLFSCNNFGDKLDLPSFYIYELEYGNVVNIGDPYYTNVKQFDFRYKEK